MSKKWKKLKFKCPDCGGTELNEVASSDRILLPVELLADENGEVVGCNYPGRDGQRIMFRDDEGPDTEHFECASCGEELQSGEDWTCEFDNVTAWFKQQQNKQKKAKV